MADAAAARDACKQLQRLIAGGGDDDGGSVASASTAATSASGRSGFRALEGGPVLLDEMNRVSLHPSEIKKLGKNLIQGLYSGEGGEEDFSLMTGAPRRRARRRALARGVTSRAPHPTTRLLPALAHVHACARCLLPGRCKRVSSLLKHFWPCAAVAAYACSVRCALCMHMPSWVPSEHHRTCIWLTMHVACFLLAWPAAEKDAIKIKKLKEKQEKQQMAAFRCAPGCACGGV